MGLLSNKRESHPNVLKLVHPGGFVELHTKPLMASQLMNKYPRHCITRPDIFRFPWIVVSLEAILRPGKVFFIVPCRTIRYLLKKSSSITTNHSSIHLHQSDHKVSSFVDQDRYMRHDKNSKGRPGTIKLPLYVGTREETQSLWKSMVTTTSTATNHTLHHYDAYDFSFVAQDHHKRNDKNSQGRPCIIKLPLCTGFREGSESLCKSSITDSSFLYVESSEGSEPPCKSSVRDTDLNSYLQETDSTIWTCDLPHTWKQLEPLHQGFPSQNKNSSSKNIQCSKKEKSLVSPTVPWMKLRKGGNKCQGFDRERHVYYSSENYYASHDAGRESHYEQVPKLKSCLKKDNIKSHNARTRNLKVRFACNEEKFKKTL